MWGLAYAATHHSGAELDKTPMKHNPPDKSAVNDTDLPPADAAPAVDSKTARKREAERLQSVGRELTELKPDLLAKLDLPTALADAIANYQRFPSRGAKRRQLQFIGRVMRDHDTQAIEAELARIKGQAASVRYELHQLEQWRERLLRDTDALTQYLSEHPVTDRQRLRQLVTKARKSTNNGTALGSTQAKADSRALFRFLRDQAD